MNESPLPDIYWVVLCRNDVRFYLADNVGEQLAEHLNNWGGKQSDFNFKTIDDLSGEPVCFHLYEIMQVWRSTPVSREYDDRVHQWRKAERDWSAG